jgi:hypothetical protein
MKNFIKLILVVSVLFLGSCKKKELELKPWGKWILRDAVMYVTYENGVKEKYAHFSSSKTISSSVLGSIPSCSLYSLGITILPTLSI